MQHVCSMLAMSAQLQDATPKSSTAGLATPKLNLYRVGGVTAM